MPIARRVRVPKPELDRIVRRLVKIYDPLRIYLFGLFSWGKPHWKSDLDFCVIVKTEEEAIAGLDRIWTEPLLPKKSEHAVNKCPELSITVGFGTRLRLLRALIKTG